MNQENEVLERDDCGACRGTGVCDMCDGSGQHVAYEGEEKIFTDDPCIHCSSFKVGKCRSCNGFGKDNPSVVLSMPMRRVVGRTVKDMEKGLER